MKSKQAVYAVVSVLLACLIAFYVWGARSWVADLYAGKATNTLTGLVEWVYPRFFTEKHRFTLDFFLQKPITQKNLLIKNDPIK